jgi:hypothetical protein
MIDHDRLAERAIRRMIAKYGAAECLRRMLSCPDQHAMPFDVIEGCRAVAVQCGEDENSNERELE